MTRRARYSWRVVDKERIPEGTVAFGVEETYLFHDGSLLAQEFRSPMNQRYLRVRVQGQPGEEWRKLVELSVRERFPGGA